MKLINNMLACEKGKALGTRLEVAGISPSTKFPKREKALNMLKEQENSVAVVRGIF